MRDNSVILEFIPKGRYVKVTAVDPNTGTEATIVGDPNAGRDVLEQLAIQKLNYVLSKRS